MMFKILWERRMLLTVYVIETDADIPNTVSEWGVRELEAYKSNIKEIQCLFLNE